MDVLHTIILGIVEGVTEFLPISSTGHMMIAAKVLGLPNSDFLNLFEVAIQSGAMLAVVALFFKRFFERVVIEKVAYAFVPTALIGLGVYPFFKSMLAGNVAVIALALFLGGIVLMLFERYAPVPHAKKLEDLTWKECVAVGLFQSIAIIPGVSRSGATIVGGQLIGISRELIVDFSFLLAAPTLFAATGYDLFKHRAELMSSSIGTLLLGTAIAGVTAYIVSKWFLHYIRKHPLAYFGIYRVFLAVVVLLFV